MSLYSDIKRTFDHSIERVGQTFEIYREDELIQTAKGVRNNKESYIAFHPDVKIQVGDRLKSLAANQIFWVIELDNFTIEDQVVKIKAIYKTDVQHNQRITSERQSNLMVSETEKQLYEVLKTIVALQEGNPNKPIPDTQIASALALPQQVVKDFLALLKDQKKADVTMAHTIHYALLTPLARVELRDPNFKSQNISPTIVNFPGNFQGAILNINSHLNNVIQVIDAKPNIDDSAKEQLKALIEELNGLLQNVPADKAEDAEAVAEQAKILVETATKDKPNKSMIRITAEGLKQAAQNISDILPNVLTVATQIITFVNKYFPPNAS